MLYQRRFLELLKFGPLAVFCAVLISLPWAIAVHQQEPDYWRYFIVVGTSSVSQVKMPSTPRRSGTTSGDPARCLPWLALLPAHCLKGWKERRNNPPMFSCSAGLLPRSCCSGIAKGKLPTYMLPLMAPLAVMIAKYGVDCCA